MRRNVRQALLIVFMLLLVQGANGETRSLTILHTNDTHAQTVPGENGIGGYATVTTYLKNTISGREDVLVVDAGDLITGSPVSTLYEGLPIFEIFNTMPYDCAALGNHEFDHGRTRLKDFLATAKFPMLCANLTGPDGELLSGGAALSMTRNGIALTIIGVMTSGFDYVTNKIGREGVTVQDPVELLTRMVPKARAQTDLVIILSHCGTREDRKIASSVPGIDVIVGGHAHERLEKPINIGGTIIVQAGSNTETVGRLDLEVDTELKKVVAYRSRLIAMDSRVYPPDPETQEVVDRWEAQVSKIVDVPIGENESTMSAQELTRHIADILKGKYKTDYGYQNPGGTRASLPKGTILKRHIWSALPFADTTAVVTANREQLKRYFSIEPSEVKQEYTVATNTFTCNRIIEKENLPESKYRTYPTLLRDVVIEYFEQHQSDRTR